jgi:NAD-dependent SIR2 family protein deacetylase
MSTATVIRVQCLACGCAYEKPETDRTIRANPGCPECSYLGWMPIKSAVGSPIHSVADRRRAPVEHTG